MIYPIKTFLKQNVLVMKRVIICKRRIRFYTTGLVTVGTYKNKLRSLLDQLAKLRQTIYDRITLFLLNKVILRQLVLQYHIALLYFRYGSEQVGSFIERFINLSTFAVIISLICSRLHIAEYLIIFCLLFIRLDFAVLAMARFYKKNTTILHQNFPKVRNPNTRGMWSRTSQIITEAATNPQVQAVAAAVGGALVWKCLDVYDTQTQKEISAADRDAEAIQRDADRDAEAIQRDADRQAEASRQKETLAAEASRQKEALAAEADQRDADRLAAHEQAAADRVEENRRLAFDKLVSPDFNDLSENQQNHIRQVIDSGKL
jgi:hypothetical protein